MFGEKKPALEFVISVPNVNSYPPAVGSVVLNVKPLVADKVPLTTALSIFPEIVPIFPGAT